MKILIANQRGETRDSFLVPETMEKIYALGQVEENPFPREFTPEELTQRMRGVDILLTGWGSEPVTRDVLRAADALKLHVHVGGSVAAYTSKEEFDAGITVLSGNDIFAQSVAEGCIGYMLMAQRRMPKYMAAMADMGWKQAEDQFYEGLLGKRVGLVGYGTITRYLCRLLKAFDTELLVYSSYPVPDPEVRQANLEEIFSTCDIISLHSAWNKRTEGMIRQEHFARMKEGALFVNTARGPIVEEAAMKEALVSGRIRAILDVYHNEPLAADDILRSLTNVYLLPHMAGPTTDMRARVGRALAEDMERFLQGEACRYQITPEAAARMTIERR